MRKYQPQAIIRKAAIYGMLAAASLFISKPVFAEGALASDSTALAKFRLEAQAAFQKSYPTLASVLSGKPETAAVREEDVRLLASNASKINSLYDQVNRYSNLTEAERAELGKKVAASNDLDLIDTYNEAKANAAPAKIRAQPEEMPAKIIVPEQEKLEAAPAQGNAADINGLYDQVNMYSSLTEAERTELGKRVDASGDADLIDTYNEAKANAAPAPAVKPAPKDSSGYVVVLPSRIEERVAAKTPPEKQASRTASLKQTEVELYERGVTNPEVIKAVSPAGLAALKDSLSNAINACYDSINAMTPENYLGMGIRIGQAICGIDAIIARSFPKGDPWARYTMANLREYFADACAAMQGRKQ